MFGFLILDKPPILSSRTAIDHLVRLVKPTKVGHAGTLDPLATGVLVTTLGPATRLTSYVQSMPKTYRATFQLGLESSTEDITGDVSSLPHSPRVSESDLVAVLPQFMGTILQRPPQFSALRVNGRRAYKLARHGGDFELPARPIEIYELHLVRFEYPEFDLEIRCGSGTYVRSLGRDIGRAVGSAAVMTSLRRTSIGTFLLDRAVEPTTLRNTDIAQHLIAPREVVRDLHSVKLDQRQCDGLLDGVPVDLNVPAGVAQVAAVDTRERLIAILKLKDFGLFAPTINFAHYWRKCDIQRD